MWRTTAALVAAAGVMVLAGCSSGGSGTAQAGGATPAPATERAAVAQTPPARTTTTQAAPAAASRPTATVQTVTTGIDPCSLLTQSEATSLSGLKVGAGKPDTSTENGNDTKTCSYQLVAGAGPGGAVIVGVVGVKPGQDVGKAWDELESDLKRSAAESAKDPDVKVGWNVDDVSGIGDRAAVAELTLTASVAGHAVTENGGDVWVQDGDTLFYVGDLALNGPDAPTADALEGAATTILGRL